MIYQIIKSNNLSLTVEFPCLRNDRGLNNESAPIRPLNHFESEDRAVEDHGDRASTCGTNPLDSPTVTLQWITFLFAAFLSLLNWPLVSNRAFQLSELSETVICRSGQWKGRVEEPLKSYSTSKYAASFCSGPCRNKSSEWVTASCQFIVLMFCFMGYCLLWTLALQYFYYQKGPWDLNFVIQ